MLLARLHLAPGVTDEEAAAAFADMLGRSLPVEKALRDPLGTGAKGAARKEFMRLQGQFTTEVHALVSQVNDVSSTALAIRNHAPDLGQADKLLDGLIRRTHRRAVAQANAMFDRYFEDAFELGLAAGGSRRADRRDDERVGLLANEKEIVRRQRLNENAFADNFFTDIEHREGTMDYRQRTQLYVNALEELYWQGYLYADLSADRYLKWQMAGSESCIDCCYLAGATRKLASRFDLDRKQVRQLQAGGRWGSGVYSARELATMGIVPQSGKLACTTNCHCKLVPAKRPRGNPRLGEAKETFESLERKDFTGTVTDEQGKVQVERQAKRKRREGYAKKAAKTEHTHRGRE